MDLLITVVGWAGAALLLLAYGMTSTGRLPPEGGRFQSLNLVGALALTANSGYHGAWPSVGLNIIWIVIGVGALARGRRRVDSSVLPKTVDSPSSQAPTSNFPSES